MKRNENDLDCVVVGGGAAGLSAALVLGRARRRIMLVDAGRQSNLPAHGIGGLLGHEGRPPAELYEMGRRELAGFPGVSVVDGTVVAGEGADGSFTLRLESGEEVTSRRVLLATGLDYETPALPGLDALWGRSVFHCPFCHGWEVRGRGLAVLADGDQAMHGALMLRGWTDDLVLLTDGPSELEPEQVRTIEAAGVRIDERRVTGLVATGGELTAVAFEQGQELLRAGLMVPTTMRQRSDLAASLGAELKAHGPQVEQKVVVDNLQRTSVPGLFAAGDVAVEVPQVASAIATGSMAGAGVVRSLLAEDYGVPEG